MRTASLSALLLLVLAHSTAFAQDVNDYDFQTEEGIHQVSFLQDMEFPAPAVPEFNQSEAVCCTPEGPCFSDHMHSIFGEYILFSPGNADLPYAEPVDGANAAAVPIGPVASLRPNHSSSFRAGGAFALDKCSSIAVTFTNYENSTTDNVDLVGGNGFLRSLTTHPQTVNVAADSLSVDGSYGIDFRTIDVDYRSLLSGSCNHAINASAGIRTSSLDQTATLNYLINGLTTVQTDVGFDGTGPRFGIDGEKLVGEAGFLFYGKSAANFLIGEFKGNYRQTNVFNGVEAVSGFQDTRIVNILELETGIGWESANRRFRITSGYQVAGWFNTMTTSSFIDSTRAHNFDTSDETLLFDGLVVRAEVRF